MGREKKTGGDYLNALHSFESFDHFMVPVRGIAFKVYLMSKIIEYTSIELAHNIRGYCCRAIFELLRLAQPSTVAACQAGDQVEMQGESDWCRERTSNRRYNYKGSRKK